MNMNFLTIKRPDIPVEITTEIIKVHKEPKLFGSRFMSCYFGYGGRDKNSDWDFAFPYCGAEYKENKLLEELGWLNKPTEKYKDSMHFQTWEKHIAGHKVQMCSKINLALFMTTYEKISPEFYWKYLHKSSKECLPKQVQTDIFNQLYAMNGL